jgi:hypothetical protein
VVLTRLSVFALADDGRAVFADDVDVRPGDDVEPVVRPLGEPDRAAGLRQPGDGVIDALAILQFDHRLGRLNRRQTVRVLGVVRMIRPPVEDVRVVIDLHGWYADRVSARRGGKAQQAGQAQGDKSVAAMMHLL